MTRKYGGTGLGLAISKRLAEMMGGTLWVETAVGKGSIFHLTISAREAPGMPYVYPQGTQPILTDKQVLVVDDNATNRLILTRQLESWGMVVHTAASAHEAMNIIRQNRSVDIAILDMHMPDMDGLALAVEINRCFSTNATNTPDAINATAPPSDTTLPLILMPSMEPSHQVVRETGITFAVILTKPVKPALLHQSLINIFSESSPSDSETAQTWSSVAARKPPASETINPDLAQEHPLHILLAEDNAVNQKVALRLLQRMGYRADVAANGLEVLEALERQPYDVVLMDVQMPEMDGWSATQHIRSDWPSACQPHIIAMTAHALPEDRERCLNVGMNDYISKPFRVEELTRALLQVKPLSHVGIGDTASCANE
jgi:CheY-like chemotaxis protein